MKTWCKCIVEAQKPKRQRKRTQNLLFLNPIIFKPISLICRFWLITFAQPTLETWQMSVIFSHICKTLLPSHFLVPMSSTASRVPLPLTLSSQELRQTEARGTELLFLCLKQSESFPSSPPHGWAEFPYSSRSALAGEMKASHQPTFNTALACSTWSSMMLTALSSDTQHQLFTALAEKLEPQTAGSKISKLSTGQTLPWAFSVFPKDLVISTGLLQMTWNREIGWKKCYRVMYWESFLFHSVCYNVSFYCIHGKVCFPLSIHHRSLLQHCPF